MSEQNTEICYSYLRKLCVEIPERCVGSEGNRRATRFFEHEIASLGWNTDVAEFEAIDWEEDGASLTCGGRSFEVYPSPYSTGCDVTANLVSASSIDDLERLDFNNRILLLHGDVAREQLMPKNFVFYNPEEHRRIIYLLEKGSPGAIVCATDRNAALAGGVYPFPLIEDGDLDIPSVYMTEEQKSGLIECVGKQVRIRSVSRRIPGKAFQVTAKRGNNRFGRIVLAAHIDAKKGSPGAIDNATGVTALLLFARLLGDFDGEVELEIVAFNGEDYYCAPGQMLYVRENQDSFNDILLNITIDGAGYTEGKTALSLFNVPDNLRQHVVDTMSNYDGLIEGPEYPQGDHFIFVQHGRPAIAVSSAWLIENLENQQITHTADDNLGIVDCNKVAEIADVLSRIIRGIVNSIG